MHQGRRRPGRDHSTARSRNVHPHHPHRRDRRPHHRRTRRALEHPRLRRDARHRRGRSGERARGRPLGPHLREHAAVAHDRRPPRIRARTRSCSPRWPASTARGPGTPPRSSCRRRDDPRRQAHAVGSVRHRPGRGALHGPGSRRTACRRTRWADSTATAIAAGFGLDEEFTPLTVMAVGELGDIRAASDELQARENAPRVRRPIADSLLVND